MIASPVTFGKSWADWFRSRDDWWASERFARLLEPAPDALHQISRLCLPNKAHLADIAPGHVQIIHHFHHDIDDGWNNRSDEIWCLIGGDVTATVFKITWDDSLSHTTFRAPTWTEIENWKSVEDVSNFSIKADVAANTNLNDDSTEVVISLPNELLPLPGFLTAALMMEYSTDPVVLCIAAIRAIKARGIKEEPALARAVIDQRSASLAYVPQWLYAISKGMHGSGKTRLRIALSSDRTEGESEWTAEQWSRSAHMNALADRVRRPQVATAQRVIRRRLVHRGPGVDFARRVEPPPPFTTCADKTSNMLAKLVDVMVTQATTQESLKKNDKPTENLASEANVSRSKTPSTTR
jgi:hypothetical protein